MRPRETLLIVAREVREAIRNRWFLLSAASFLGLSLGLSLLGLAGSMRSGFAGFDRTTASLLNVMLLFVPLMTLSLGGLGVAGELEDGSLATLLSQPVTRAEVYTGKFLGLLAAVWASILLGFGVTGIVVGLFAGGGNVGAFVGLVTLVMLLALATLAIGTLLSVLLRTRARVVGAAFAVWLFLVYASDLGTIGLVVARNLAPQQVFFLAVLNPIEDARLLGTLALSGRLDVLGPVGLFGLDRFGPTGLRVLLSAALGATTLVSFLWGYRVFRRTPVS